MIELIRRPIQAAFDSYRQQFESMISSEDGYLAEIVGHLKSSRGKELRPTLSILSAALFGNAQAAIPVAVSLELLHTASLLHDDVVDESDLRRSKPTVNAKWGNKVAILTGDYFLSKAICSVSNTNALIVGEIGLLGSSLSEGELIQLHHSAHCSADEKAYFEIIAKKTAKMFALAAACGPILNGADEVSVRSMRSFGEYLGLIFQIRDDIFDYFSDPSVGKPLGNDLLEGKITLPLIYFLSNPDSDAEIVGRCRSLMADGHLNPESVKYIYDAVIAHGGVDYAESVIQEIKSKAVHSLDLFPDSEVKNSLLLCLDFAGRRQN